tara:strand:+ start:1009 stop:1515 length:507 start_codon:yes stop_codon:yes gene_type:complete
LNYQPKAGEKARIDEAEFTRKLENPVKASYQQDMKEHWDVQGTLEGQLSKFEVKGLKRFNRNDAQPQDNMACVEYIGITGYPGWVQGKSDYIAFKRIKYPWLVVNRQQLWEMVEAKLKERNYSPSIKPWYEKEAYATYDRSYFGKKDKFCWVPYEDIEQIKDIKKLEK